MDNHSDDPERLEAFIECLKWLEQRRQDLGWEVKSDEYIEAVAAASEHFEYLQRPWAGGSYEGFRESLRRYASAIAQEMLRIHKEGVSVLKTEEEVLEAFREERDRRSWEGAA